MNKENEIQAGRNIFKIDGPIGRKRFIQTLVVLLIVNIAVWVLVALITLPFGINIYTFPICAIIVGIFLIIAMYISVINYMKRFFDIIGRKDKAILYTLLIQGGTIAMSFIPQLKYIGALIGLVTLAFCLLKKGQLTQPHNNTDEQQQA